MNTRTASLSPRIAITGRILAAVLGGYAFCWGLMALGTAGLYALGMEFHDAEHLSAIIGFLIYASVFMWAFAARRMLPVWVVLLAGGALMTGAAFWIQSVMVG